MTIAEHYERIAPSLTNYLVASGSSYHTACDIVQETFLRVWRHRDDLMDDEAQVSGYVYTIARNIRKDIARKLSRETLQEEITDADMESGLGTSSSAACATATPVEEDEERRVLRKRLENALAGVPPILREAFLLFQLSGLSIREIARQTNSTESLVKVRIHRAKNRLRELLGQENQKIRNQV